MERLWNVRVIGQGRSIGQVREEDEALGRCAALACFGVGEEDIRAGRGGAGERMDFFRG